MKQSLLTLILFHFICFGFAQNIGVELIPMPGQPVLKSQLIAANKISDINEGYPSSWISSYVSVALTTSCNGEMVTIKSKDDQFTKEQLSLLEAADFGANVSVDVKYYPENGLKNNDVKDINFSLTIVPEESASFPGGKELLEQYIMDKTIEKVSESKAKLLEFATVRLTVTEEGKVENTKIGRTSGNTEFDNLLLSTINEMPYWKPAKSAEGALVSQEFVLSLGDQNSCLRNLVY